MRIAINCRSFLNKNYTGIGRYAYNLVKSLSEIDSRNEYWLYAQKKYFDFKRKVPRVPASNFAVKVDWLGQGIAKTLSPIDIYHSPSPDFINIERARVIVTVHDLVYKTYPEGHTPQTRETAEHQLIGIVDRADKIICCSQSIHDLKQYFPSGRIQVCLVYQGSIKIFSIRCRTRRKVARQVTCQRASPGRLSCCRDDRTAQEFAESPFGLFDPQNKKQFKENSSSAA